LALTQPIEVNVVVIAGRDMYSKCKLEYMMLL